MRISSTENEKKGGQSTGYLSVDDSVTYDEDTFTHGDNDFRNWRDDSRQ